MFAFEMLFEGFWIAHLCLKEFNEDFPQIASTLVLLYKPGIERLKQRLE